MPLLTTQSARGFGFSSGLATVLPGTFDLIETASVTSAVSSVTFSNLNTYAADYKHLRIVSHTLDNLTSNNTWINIRFNGDTGSNYYYSNIRFSDGNTGGSMAATNNATLAALAATRDNPSGGDSSYGVVAVANIADYSSTNKQKSFVSWGSQYQSNGWTQGLWSGVWKSTSAITSITISPDSGYNFTANSRIYLYGIKG
jgi:hypothetical protein